MEANAGGDAQGALRFFQSAVDLDPANSRHLLSAANMLLKLGVIDEAVSAYRRLRMMPLSEKQAADMEDALRRA